MKKIALFSFILWLSFSFSACKKIKDLLTFTITDQTNITISPSNFLGIDIPFNVPTPNVTTNSSQEFRNNNTDVDLVKDVKLEELKLTITAPSGKTFSFLKHIYVYISTNANYEILLASQENVVSSANTIILTTTQEKLDKYIKASSYKVRTRVVTRETINQSIDIQIDSRFKVTADPL